MAFPNHTTACDRKRNLLSVCTCSSFTSRSFFRSIFCSLVCPHNHIYPTLEFKRLFSFPFPQSVFLRQTTMSERKDIRAATTDFDDTTAHNDDSFRVHSANNLVYVDIATAFFYASVTLNYEHTWDHAGVRVGFGTRPPVEARNWCGTMAMWSVFPSDEHRFELGAGFSVIKESRPGPYPVCTVILPAGNICYRIQRSDGGLLLESVSPMFTTTAHHSL